MWLNTVKWQHSFLDTSDNVSGSLLLSSCWVADKMADFLQLNLLFNSEEVFFFFFCFVLASEQYTCTGFHSLQPQRLNLSTKQLKVWNSVSLCHRREMIPNTLSTEQYLTFSFTMGHKKSTFRHFTTISISVAVALTQMTH